MITRIDKLIASQGKYSRNDVKKLIKTGSVRLDGIPVSSPEQKLDPDTQTVTLCGQVLCIKEHLYIMMNKPQGVISAGRDNKQKTVLDLLPDELRRPGLFPAGRLDIDTTGFVFITDDGAFAHKLLAPKSHVDKTYWARLAEPLTEDTFEKFQHGVVLKDDSVCLSAELTVLEDTENPLVEVVIHQGMYHQIKRMFAACANRVIALKRIRIGDLDLDETLKPGECRELLPQELQKIQGEKR